MAEAAASIVPKNGATLPILFVYDTRMASRDFICDAARNLELPHQDALQACLTKVSPFLNVTGLPCRLPNVILELDMNCALQCLEGRTRFSHFSPKKIVDLIPVANTLPPRLQAQRVFQTLTLGALLQATEDDKPSDDDGSNGDRRVVGGVAESSAPREPSALSNLFPWFPSHVFDGVGAVAVLDMQYKSLEDAGDDEACVHEHVIYRAPDCKTLISIIQEQQQYKDDDGGRA